VTSFDLHAWLLTNKPGPAWEVHEVGPNVLFGQPMRDGVMLYLSIPKQVLDGVK